MKKTLLTLLAALPLAASAQVLRIEIPDTTLQNGANLWVGYTYAPLKFDKKGVFEMDGKDLKNKGMAAVMLKDYSFYRVVLEPGKRQNLKITTKNGKKTVKYSGDNVAMAEFMNKFEDFSPARNWDMEQKQKKKDTISFADAFYVEECEKNDDCILCVSENKRYKPFSLPKDDIRSLSTIVGLVRLV